MSSLAFRNIAVMTVHLHLSHMMIPKVSFSILTKEIISMHAYYVYLICVYSFTYFVTTLKHSIHVAWWNLMIRKLNYHNTKKIKVMSNFTDQNIFKNIIIFRSIKYFHLYQILYNFHFRFVLEFRYSSF